MKDVPEIVQPPSNAGASISVNQRESMEINVLASLNTKGGGEQRACHIVSLLRGSGWKVNFYPWAKVHDNFKHIEMESYSFAMPSIKTGMAEHMKPGLPLLFYANDQVWDFEKYDDEFLIVVI